MTRSENINKNLIFNLIKFVLQIVIQFILRTFLIYVLSIEYVGLSGLFANIFSFLSLAELGVGTAIIYSMYKPISEGDIEKIKTLQKVYKNFYLIIALVVFCVGLVILPFIKYFINGGVTIDVNLKLLYFLYLFNTVIGYLSAHKRSLLFAYQCSNVESLIKIICMIFMAIMQIVVLFLTKNYYYFFIVNIIFTIIESVIIHIKANKLFPQLNGKAQKLDSTTKKELFKNISALSVHKIGYVVVYSTDNILISALVGIVSLGSYSNYNLVITALTSIFTLFSTTLLATVGNLIASKDVDYCHKRYKEINMFFSCLTSFCTVCLIVLLQPFVKLWFDGSFLLKFSTILLISFSFYLSKMRVGINLYKEASGLFWQDRWKPILEAVVNLVVSIILGYYIGINGIFIGTIVSTLVSFWIDPIVVYKHYFKKNACEYFIGYVKDLIVMIFGACICYFICSFIPTENIWMFIVKMMVCVVVELSILIMVYCKTDEFKGLVDTVKHILLKHKKDKK